MKIALCLITKDENDYLEEWLLHHYKIGIDHFYIYDNESEINIENQINVLCENGFVVPRDKITVTLWTQKNIRAQTDAYIHCCKNATEDLVGFLDIDEFFMSKTMDIKKDFKYMEKFGKAEGYAIYWRMYGSNPYFTERHPMTDYVQWYKNDHIKSFINPKKVKLFPDPHKAVLHNGRYIDEIGRAVEGPIGNHTSNYIWIKHIWTRSLSEWEQKISRRGWYEFYSRKRDQFFDHNNQCVLND